MAVHETAQIENATLGTVEIREYVTIHDADIDDGVQISRGPRSRRRPSTARLISTQTSTLRRHARQVRSDRPTLSSRGDLTDAGMEFQTDTSTKSSSRSGLSSALARWSSRVSRVGGAPSSRAVLVVVKPERVTLPRLRQEDATQVGQNTGLHFPANGLPTATDWLGGDTRSIQPQNRPLRWCRRCVDWSYWVTSTKTVD